MMNVPPSELVHYLRSQLPRMVELLETLTLAESPSTVPASQKAVLTPLAETLSRLKYAVRLLPALR